MYSFRAQVGRMEPLAQFNVSGKEEKTKEKVVAEMSNKGWQKRNTGEIESGVTHLSLALSLPTSDPGPTGMLPLADIP